MDDLSPIRLSTISWAGQVAILENGRSLKADYPDPVTLVELAGLGHIMMRERPDLVAEAITAFVHKLGK